MEISLSKSNKSPLSIWLKRENELLSAIMYESVTNAKMISISHAITAFFFLCFSPSAGLLAVVLCLLWFSCSLLLCYKMKTSNQLTGYYAFGEPVPPEFIKELKEDGVPKEEITTDYLETLLEYERRDKE